MKIKEINIEEAFSVILAIGSLVISGMDLFGVLDTSWIKEKIPSITLILISSLILYLVFERTARFSKISATIDFIKQLSIAEGIERVKLLRSEIPTSFEYIFQDKFNESEDMYKDILLNKQFIENNKDRINYYYRKFLKSTSPEHYYSTSIPSKSYIWGDDSADSMTEQNIEYIKNGGKITRIFYISEAECDSKATIDILNKQFEIGVEVYVAKLELIPVRLRKLFVFTEKMEIGFEGVIDHNHGLIEMIFTIDKDKIKKYQLWYNQLLESTTTKKYFGNNPTATS